MSEPGSPDLGEVEISSQTAPAARGQSPGPGGWGAILRYRRVEKELSRADPATTSNRMELTAGPIAGLEALKRPCRVRLYSDSQYLRDGITKWIHGWKARAWFTADKKAVKNVPICGSGVEAAAPAPPGRMDLGARPCRGHPENERADARARPRWRCPRRVAGAAVA